MGMVLLTVALHVGFNVQSTAAILEVIVNTLRNIVWGT